MSSENNNFYSYAGFTVGPIYDVLSHSRKTRELWFGSYFFSWFMEKIIEELSKNKQIKFLTPHVKESFEENHSKAGKYHDRFVVCSTLDKEELFKIIQIASDNALNFFVDLIDSAAKSSYIPSKSKDDIKTILKTILEGYIQRNFVVLDSSHIDTSAVVKSVDAYLNSMEENRIFEIGGVKDTCFRCKTLPGIAKAEVWSVRNNEKSKNEESKKEENLCPLCFIKYFCFKSSKVKDKINDHNFRYPPVLDIVAVGLLTDEVKNTNPIFKDYDKDYDFKDIEKVYTDKDTKDKIKPYHKYFAVMQADGDDLGKLAGSIKDPTELSHRLFMFAEAAEGLVKSFKGEPIYIGGDDILAFMPVAFKGADGIKTVFDLAIELSKTYQDIVNDGAADAKKSTLSIGINIAYYKFPLSKALENARHQLFVEAKSGDKNAVAICLTKHSGFQTTFKFRFDSDEIKHFKELLNAVLAGDIDITHSLHHNLHRFIKVIANINDKKSLDAFFENNFNEAVHSRYADGFECVKEMFKGRIQPLKKENERINDIKDLLNKLRFIKFLRGDK
jgi:CRISPR-associated protein Cmr2